MTYHFRITPPEGEPVEFTVTSFDDRHAWRVAWQTFSAESRPVGSKLNLVRVQPVVA